MSLKLQACRKDGLWCCQLRHLWSLISLVYAYNQKMIGWEGVSLQLQKNILPLDFHSIISVVYYVNSHISWWPRSEPLILQYHLDVNLTRRRLLLWSLILHSKASIFSKKLLDPYKIFVCFKKYIIPCLCHQLGIALKPKFNYSFLILPLIFVACHTFTF